MEAFGRILIVVGLSFAALSSTGRSLATVVDRPCVGDCNRDGRVTVDELVVGINVGLGRQPMTDCSRLDANGDGLIAVDDLVSAVRDGLAACSFPSVSIDQSGDPIIVETNDLRAELTRTPLRMSFLEPGGTLRTVAAPLTREADDAGFFYERQDARHSLGEILDATAIHRGLQLTVATSEGPPATVWVRFLTQRTVQVDIEPPSPETVTALGERWHSPADELIYGLTERLRDSELLANLETPRDDIIPVEVGSLNRRGEMVEMFIRPTFSLYTPFYQSSRGYGLLVAETMPGQFDLASSEAETLSFELETGTRPENQRLTFYLFLGPDHATILDEYTDLTGRPFVPPDWAFRNWRWRGELAVGAPAELDGVPVNAQMAEDVLMFETFGIPPGVYLFDRPVFPGNFGFARFEWDETRMPNPDSMLDSLRQRGYKLALWSATWLCGSEPGDNGSVGQELGFIAPGPAEEDPPLCADIGGTNFIMDVTNPEARSWFRAELAEFLARYGIQAIKLDRGEEHIPSAATDIWADGRTGREVHNDYVRIQTKIHRDALADAFPDGDFTVLTRSGYTGTQKDAVFWGGDIPASEFFGFGPSTDLGLRSAIISQQRAAYMGFPIWGSDTGGYYEFKDRDVFARWIQFSCFSGIMEIGGVGNHAPWDMPTEPNFDLEMIEIYRRYTSLREQLLPYIVGAATRAGESGLPIVRPLSFLDRTDPELQDRWDQYLFGPDLLVAPIWRIGQRSREVYFPAGTWRSLWNESERFEGPATVELEAPLDTILVFIRGDAPSPLVPVSD